MSLFPSIEERNALKKENKELGSDLKNWQEKAGSLAKQIDRERKEHEEEVKDLKRSYEQEAEDMERDFEFKIDTLKHNADQAAEKAAQALSLAQAKDGSELRRKLQDLREKNAALEVRVEMYKAACDVESSVLDIEELVKTLIAKLPEFKIGSLGLTLAPQVVEVKEDQEPSI